MKKIGEWGDYIMLQVIVDVFLLYINIYNFVYLGNRCINIIMDQLFFVMMKFSIDFGYVGELYYCSFCFMNWFVEFLFSKQFLYKQIFNLNYLK